MTSLLPRAKIPDLIQRMNRRVVKLGGSLLDLDDLPFRLHSLLVREPANQTLVVTGGGPLVGWMRQRAAATPVGNEIWHELALRAMSITARYVAAACQWPTLTDLSARSLSSVGDGPAVIDAQPVLAALGGLSLPRTWDVTSDSIGAALARHLDASELWLLKSVGDPMVTRVEDWAARGWVDRHFASVAAGMVIRWWNLRVAS